MDESIIVVPFSTSDETQDRQYIYICILFLWAYQDFSRFIILCEIKIVTLDLQIESSTIRLNN